MGRVICIPANKKFSNKAFDFSLTGEAPVFGASMQIGADRLGAAAAAVFPYFPPTVSHSFGHKNIKRVFEFKMESV